MTGPVPRYIDVTVVIEVEGKPVNVKVWADLVDIANLLGPRAIRAKSRQVIDCRGAIVVKALPG
jgi:carbon monoxide dehydrogenase subunit G